MVTWVNGMEVTSTCGWGSMSGPCRRYTLPFRSPELLNTPQSERLFQNATPLHPKAANPAIRPVRLLHLNRCGWG